jgi:hypothetical protein
MSGGYDYSEQMAVADQLGAEEAARSTSLRPAAMAAARVSRANMLLGALGLASSLFVLLRLVEKWRVTASATSHHISLLGQKLSYPAANLAAFVVLLLAVFGLAVVVRAVAEAVRELTAAARFGRRMAAAGRRELGDALVF